MQRLMPWLSIALVVACGGGGSDGPKRLGKPATADALVRALHQIADAPPEAQAATLAKEIGALCGPECGCLATSTCPVANDGVPAPWPSIELAGRYLAEQVARLPDGDRPRVKDALGDVHVVVPRVDPTVWSLAPATIDRPLSPATTWVGLDKDDALSVSTMPVASFGEDGAHVDRPIARPVAALDMLVPTLAGLRGAPPPAPADDSFGFLTAAVGMTGAALPPDRPLVIADQAALATTLVSALVLHGGALAVRDGNQVRELPLVFGGVGDSLSDPTLILSLDVGEVLLTDAAHDTTRWPSDLGRYDVASFTESVKAAAPTPPALVLIQMRTGTVRDLVRLIDIALGVHPVKLHVTGANAGRWSTISDPSSATGARPRNPHAPTVRIGAPGASDGLDKAVIRRYIKRNMAKLTYCYEKRLLVEPGLEGTVNSQFRIEANGTVTLGSVTGLDAEIDACIGSVLVGIEFPRPLNDVPVVVTYPFTFKNAGL